MKRVTRDTRVDVYARGRAADGWENVVAGLVGSMVLEAKLGGEATVEDRLHHCWRVLKSSMRYLDRADRRLRQVLQMLGTHYDASYLLIELADRHIDDEDREIPTFSERWSTDAKYRLVNAGRAPSTSEASGEAADAGGHEPTDAHEVADKLRDLRERSPQDGGDTSDSEAATSSDGGANEFAR